MAVKGQTTDDLELLLAVMPERVRRAIEARSDRGSIIEIVLDGRRTVRVGAEVDTGALIRIIEALEKRR